ncbi:hypothetical protein RSAG8_13332, partial [Rhizoctonia solani AG-8 WAC10335]
MPQQFFKEAETRWMITEFLEAKEIIDLGGNTEVHGTAVESLDDLLAIVLRDFAQSFPYRDPQTDPATIPEELRTSQLSTEEWAKLRERFRNRFNYLKRQKSLGKISIETEDETERHSPESESPVGQASQADQYQPEEDAMSLDQDAPGSPHGEAWTTDPGSDISLPRVASEHAVEQNVPLDYQVDEYTRSNWNTVIRNLKSFIGRSWLDCEPEEVEWRQTTLIDDMRWLSQMIAYATGCELYVTGTMMSGGQPHAFHTTSPRSLHFADSETGIRTRKDFATHVLTYIHAYRNALCVSPQCPGAVVSPNLSRQNHPLFPVYDFTQVEKQRALHEYFSFKLQWQGGESEVPYDLIEEDGSSGRWEIVRQEVLPDTVPYMRHPMKMAPLEVLAWVNHLIDGDRQVIPESKRFQYEQPLPGILRQGYQSLRTSDAVVTYGPDAHAYAQYLHNLPSPEQPPRNDQLPIIAHLHPYYVSLSDEAVAVLCRRLPTSDPCHALTAALRRHDSMHPYEATSEDWLRVILVMPHLRHELLDEEASGDHIVSDNSYLPEAFFSFQHPDHYLNSLTHTLEWCSAYRWTHKLSGTLKGGSMGIKWPVILLIHLRNNVHRFLTQPERMRAHYRAEIDPSFLDKEIEHIDSTIESLCIALDGSSETLSHSVQQRTVPSPRQHAASLLEQAHRSFPDDLDNVTWWYPLPPTRGWMSQTHPQEIESKAQSQETMDIVDEDTTQPSSSQHKVKAITQIIFLNPPQTYHGQQEFPSPSQEESPPIRKSGRRKVGSHVGSSTAVQSTPTTPAGSLSTLEDTGRTTRSQSAKKKSKYRGRSSSSGISLSSELPRTPKPHKR